MKLLLVAILCCAPSAFARVLHVGGGDSGGADFVTESVPRLRDLANCPGARLRVNAPILTTPISMNVQRIDPSGLRRQLIARGDDQLLVEMIFLAARYSNWYLVDSELQLNGESKLAVFKRPLGILVSQPLFIQMSRLDQVGVLIHESLRMVSIGFRIALSSEAIEDLTCRLMSGQPAEAQRYTPFRHMYQQRDVILQMMRYFELDEEFTETTWDFQKKSSKFETLLRQKPDVSPEQAEEALYKWIAELK